MARQTDLGSTLLRGHACSKPVLTVDSWNLVVPHSGCQSALNGTSSYETYQQLRGGAALSLSELLPISVAVGTQPCSTFGLHPALPLLKYRRPAPCRASAARSPLPCRAHCVVLSCALPCRALCFAVLFRAPRCVPCLVLRCAVCRAVCRVVCRAAVSCRCAAVPLCRAAVPCHSPHPQ